MHRSFGHAPTLLLFVTFLTFSCGDGRKAQQQPPASPVSVPSFNADSAYAFVSRQVAFGPRIPNTKAHRDAGDFIIHTLRAYGAKTITQEFQATTFDGQKLSLRNIIGSFNPEKQKRVILAAHWDTRPYSDKDPVYPRKPFDGANDGASGVGVLLEVARHLKNAPDIGVDLIFFDGEDWGEPDDGATTPTPEGLDSWWCLGSQYWAKHKHTPSYRPQFGILIDMVGSPDARFFQEGTSVFYASNIVEKVWATAARRGYGSVFVRQKESPITDDHLFVNQLADIPMIDITPFEPGVGYFGAFHHTQQDNLALISRETLGIVGDVLMQVIYLEE